MAPRVLCVALAAAAVLLRATAYPLIPSENIANAILAADAASAGVLSPFNSGGARPSTGQVVITLFTAGACAPLTPADVSVKFYGDAYYAGKRGRGWRALAQHKRRL